MLILSLIVLVLVVALALLLKYMPMKSARRVWPVHAKKPLSHVEQALYFRLAKALPELVILAQVQYSRFLGLKKGAHNPLSVLNGIQHQSADFLICDKSLTVLAVIELEDASHAHRSRRRSDAAKQAVLKVAGIRLIRWQVSDLPDTASIRETFTSTSSGNAALTESAEP